MKDQKPVILNFVGNDDIDNYFKQSSSLAFLDQEFHKIHIKKLKRNGRKWLTIIDGLTEDLEEIQALAKGLRKALNCIGAVKDVKQQDAIGSSSYIIQLSGDVRHESGAFLVNRGLYEESQLIIHGD